MSIPNMPNNLTDVMINSLGDAYLAKYPRPKTWWASLFHDNHKFATSLQQYSGKNPQDGWNFLIGIYKQLPNTNGSLACDIEKLFKKAFGITIQKFVTATTVYVFKPEQVASTSLTPAVNKFYHQHQNTVGRAPATLAVK